MEVKILKNDLAEIANTIWVRTLKIHRNAQETRIASSLSAIEIFVVLYYEILNIFPSFPLHKDRDRCIISKGHGSICLYPILADLGFFPESLLDNVCKFGSNLGGIPDPVIPGYETLNGSLGHGIGVGAGIALGLKKNKQFNQNVYVVAGDGEFQEGSMWEAIMFAAHHELDNVTLIIDNNRKSMLGKTQEISSNTNFFEKFKAFGWNYEEVDGHDVYAIKNALLEMKTNDKTKPKVLVANTIKGRGIPLLENSDICHVLSVHKDELDKIIGEWNDRNVNNERMFT